MVYFLWAEPPYPRGRPPIKVRFGGSFWASPKTNSKYISKSDSPDRLGKPDWERWRQISMEFFKGHGLLIEGQSKFKYLSFLSISRTFIELRFLLEIQLIWRKKLTFLDWFRNVKKPFLYKKYNFLRRTFFQNNWYFSM